MLSSVLALSPVTAALADPEPTSTVGSESIPVDADSSTDETSAPDDNSSPVEASAPDDTSAPGAAASGEVPVLLEEAESTDSAESTGDSGPEVIAPAPETNAARSTAARAVQSVAQADPAIVPPSAPQNVRVATLPDGGVRITWDPPADWGTGANRSYSLEWQGVSTTSDTTRAVFEPTVFQVGVTYAIVVSTYTNQGATSAAPVSYTRTGRPQAPTSVSAAPAGPGTILISWAAPVNTGGLPITRYDAFRREVGSGIWIPGPSGISANARDALASGLTIGVEYEFIVVASNSVGEGPDSASARATPIDVPRRPTIQSVTAGDGRIDLRWDSSFGVDSYAIEMNDGGGFVEVPATISGTSASITGLTNGRTYTIRVGAVNAAGRSASDSVQVKPLAPEAPGAPQALQATAVGSERVLLQWQAPASDGRSPITSYVVERRGQGGQPWVTLGTPTSTSLEVGQDAGTTVAYRVSAVNAIGQGSTGDSVSVTAIAVPPAPQDLVVTSDDGAVSLAWTAPTSSAAAPVDGYVVERRVAGGDWSAPTSVTISGTTARVTGLANGSALEFRVLATNGAGRGAASETVTTTPATVPGAPTGLAAVGSDGEITLTWSAPEADGGAVVSGYVVQRLVDGEWVAAAGVSVDGTSATITGLTNGLEVALRVLAVNRVGAGSASGSALATPFTVPDAVTGLQATPASATVSLAWVAPAFTGGATITSYVIEQRSAGGDWIASTAVVTGTSAVVSGLTNGEAYDFRVATVNAAGRGPSGAAVSATPFTVPDEPTDLRAVAGDGAISLAWRAPAFDGGAGVERYLLEIRAVGAQDWTTVPADAIDDTTAVIGGLENGQAFELRVSAVNAAGTGLPTSAITAVPITIADAPTDLAATPGAGQATLTWTAPASTGGAAIDSYIVEQLVEGDWAVVAVTPVADGTRAVVTDLENGEPVRFRVAADTAAGVGARSATVDVTPFTTATAPTGLSVVASDGRIVVSWQAPASTGGRDIIGYVVEQRVGDGAWTAATSTTAATSATLTGLPNGVEVDLRVAAVTQDAGIGAFAGPLAATPFAFAPTVVGPTGATLTGSTVRKGDSVTVTANNLPIGARVVVELGSDSTELASVLIGADGVLRVQARIPVGATLGGHELVVLLTGDDLAFAPSVTPFIVEAAPVVPAPVVPDPMPPAAGDPSGPPVPTTPVPTASATAGDGRGALSRTGSDSLLPMLLLGLALLGVGVAVRRRTVAREH